MAFVRNDFNTIGGQARAGVTPAMYVYTTTEAHTVVDGSGYFNDIADILNVGDMIIVHGSTGGTRTVTMHVVVSNSSSVVDISNGTVIAVVTDDD